MDSMYRPYNFHKSFFGSYSYVFSLVIPNTIFVYWGFPAEARLYGMYYAIDHEPKTQTNCTASYIQAHAKQAASGQEFTISEHIRSCVQC